jgi:CHAT domain-containing protein
MINSKHLLFISFCAIFTGALISRNDNFIFSPALPVTAQETKIDAPSSEAKTTKDITKTKSLLSLYFFKSTPNLYQFRSEYNYRNGEIATFSEQEILNKDLSTAEQILESISKLGKNKEEVLVVPSAAYSNVFNPGSGCISKSKDLKNQEAISCQEAVLASVCKLASDTGDRNKTVAYCDRYFKEFEKNLSTYQPNKTAFDFADSQRCFGAFNLKYIDKSSTLKHCLNLVERYNTNPPLDDKYSLLADIAVNYIYRQQGKYNEAIEFIRSQVQKNSISRAVTEKEKSDNSSKLSIRLASLELLGDTYLEMGAFDKAVEAYQQNKEEGLAKQEFNFSGGSTYTSLDEELVQIQTKLGYALLHSGQLDRAEQELLAASKLLDEGAGQGVGYRPDVVMKVQDRNRVLYTALQKLRIQQGKYSEALEFAEKARSTLLKNQLSRSLPDSFRNKTKILFQFSQIQAEAKNHNSTFVIYSILERPFEIYNPSQKQVEEIAIWVVTPDGQLHFQNVQTASLINNSVSSIANHHYFLSMFIFTLVFTLIWRLRKNIKSQYLKHSLVFSSLSLLILTSCQSLNTQIERGQNTQSISQSIDELYSLVNSRTVTNSQCSSQDKCLEEIYKNLIQPIEKFLPNDPESEVVFFPYLKLYSVPFAALRDKQGKYLIEKNTISLAPAVEGINLLRARRKQNSFAPANNLVIGNPIMPKVSVSQLSDPITLSPLPGAEAEATEVAKLLGTTAFIGTQATEPAVFKQLANAKFIHLATHAIDYTNLPFNLSFLALTASGNDPLGKDDGLLTSEELYQIPLIGELAVLSACNTNSGTTTVEGVLGLANPFLISGIPTVVASLWSIPDTPTQELMVDFYKNIQTTPNKAQALRQAMLTTMKKHPDPKNWAAFVLIGLPDTPKSTISPSQKTQAVGQASCGSIRRDQLNNVASPIKRATLESTERGFNLRLVESEAEILLELDNNLVVQAASTNGIPWSLVSYDKQPFTINPDGSFEMTMMQSTRTGCSFTGKLEFLGNAKQKVSFRGQSK